MSRYSGRQPQYPIYSDDSDDEIDIHFHRGHGSPPRRSVRYAEAPPQRYYPGEIYRVPAEQERMVVRTRNHRSRSRSRQRRSSSPRVSSPPNNIIINNNVTHSDSEETSDDELKVTRHRHRRHSSRPRSHRRYSPASSRTRSRSRSRSSGHERYALEHIRRDYERDADGKRREYEKDLESKKRDYELEQAQRELREMKLAAKIEHDEKLRERTAKEEHELREAKRELDQLQDAKDREELEKRIKQKIELQRLKDEDEAKKEKERQDKAEKAAVEKYKKAEAERVLREQEEAEKADKELKAKLQESLLKSGLDEKEINTILAGKKIKKEEDKGKEKAKEPVVRPTYTRMARRYLSLETLRAYNIDYQLDQDPEYLLIKRWVPEMEQDTLWQHTRYVREQRRGMLMLTMDENKPHRQHLEPEFEWVREKKKKDKKHSRSRSPSLIKYFAGVR